MASKTLPERRFSFFFLAGFEFKKKTSQSYCDLGINYFHNLQKRKLDGKGQVIKYLFFFNNYFTKHLSYSHSKWTLIDKNPYVKGGEANCSNNGGPEGISKRKKVTPESLWKQKPDPKSRQEPELKLQMLSHFQILFVTRQMNHVL